MITLDASFLIAHLSPRDAHHADATAFLRENPEEPLLIHSINLAEVLVGGVRAGRGAELLADLESVGVRVADHDEEEPLRLATLRAESGLRLPDCCALRVALVHKSPLATFDDNLAEAARRRSVPVVPERAHRRN